MIMKPLRAWGLSLVKGLSPALFALASAANADERILHYLSDVLGGWTAGLACALLACWADGRLGTVEPTFQAEEEGREPERPWHAPSGAGGPSAEGYTEGGPPPEVGVRRPV